MFVLNCSANYHENLYIKVFGYETSFWAKNFALSLNDCEVGTVFKTFFCSKIKTVWLIDFKFFLRVAFWQWSWIVQQIWSLLNHIGTTIDHKIFWKRITSNYAKYGFDSKKKILKEISSSVNLLRHKNFLKIF